MRVVQGVLILQEKEIRNSSTSPGDMLAIARGGGAITTKNGQEVIKVEFPGGNPSELSLKGFRDQVDRRRNAPVG